MNGIEVTLIGRMGGDAQLRKTDAGKSWLSFSCAVKLGDETQWVSVSHFNNAAPELAALLCKGVEVYCEGRLRLTSWEKAGEQRAGLSVNASKVEPLGVIGKRRRPIRRRRKPHEAEQHQAGTPSGEAADLVEDAA